MQKEILKSREYTHISFKKVYYSAHLYIIYPCIISNQRHENKHIKLTFEMPIE